MRSTHRSGDAHIFSCAESLPLRSFQTSEMHSYSSSPLPPRCIRDKTLCCSKRTHASCALHSRCVTQFVATGRLVENLCEGKRWQQFALESMSVSLRARFKHHLPPATLKPPACCGSQHRRHHLPTTFSGYTRTDCICGVRACNARPKSRASVISMLLVSILPLLNTSATTFFVC